MQHRRLHPLVLSCIFNHALLGVYLLQGCLTSAMLETVPLYRDNHLLPSFKLWHNDLDQLSSAEHFSICILLVHMYLLLFSHVIELSAAVKLKPRQEQL